MNNFLFSIGEAIMTEVDDVEDIDYSRELTKENELLIVTKERKRYKLILEIIE